ncbi:site-specific DNA-methyltransferase [Paracraurococcus ruber]|uniref:DNA modification methylase n=1 Tax=Paracraurococcus ruber TaxID=77675 RepID=A0ABS1D561_9PROT|nr:site-specific DNA-methyltransferase [Paracraurococcus ruber]MBK1661992.1 DNA modification methylase [Paracraurococcus ruber]TDG27128.1 site-specific DNA-methyltransferase [Paracraurococcus ruber]
MTEAAEAPAPVRRKRVQGGVATADVVLSAHAGGNADLFPRILALHVPDGAVVADVTYGQGVFWRQVPPGRYRLLASDLSTGTDCRALPHADASVDALVLDPPYMEGLLRPKAETRGGQGSHAALRTYYDAGGGRAGPGGGRWHQAVLDLYLDAAREARRVLRDHGILIVKCQDEVSANRQELTHVQIVTGLAAMGFYARDLFVLVRPNRPGVARLLKQVHARKNHSYFLVFQKVPAGQDPARYRTRDLLPGA